MNRIRSLWQAARASSRFRGGLVALSGHLAVVIRRDGWRAVADRIGLRSAQHGAGAPDEGERYRAWVRLRERRDRALLHAAAAGSGGSQVQPDRSNVPPGRSIAIAVLVPWRRETDVHDLRRTIDSVLAQCAGTWDIRVLRKADTEAPAGIADGPVRLIDWEATEPLGAALERARSSSRADLVCMVEPGDRLHRMAGYWLAEASARHGQAEIIYTDSDSIGADGQRCLPYFKPAFDPDLLLSHDYLSGLAVYRSTVIDRFGGLGVLAPQATGFDWALRAVEATPTDRIVHVADVLFSHRAGHGMSGGDRHARECVAGHLRRTGMAGTVSAVPESPGFCRVSFAWPDPRPEVDIVIPTRDQAALLGACIESIERVTSYRNFRLTLIDNGSIEPAAIALLGRLATRPHVRVIHDARPFNFSALINRAAAESASPLLCVLNNDIVVRSPGWLGDLAAQALRDQIGCAGARLWYPDGSLQHAGIVTGINESAGHVFAGIRAGDAGLFGRAAVLRTVTAVTAACLVVQRDRFDRIGGFDESFPVAFNDVDFCLRLQACGYRNVWVPTAELEHHESRSRGYERDAGRLARLRCDIARLRARWGASLSADPYYSPNLSLQTTDARLRLDADVARSAPLIRRSAEGLDRRADLQPGSRFMRSVR